MNSKTLSSQNFNFFRFLAFKEPSPAIFSLARRQTRSSRRTSHVCGGVLEVFAASEQRAPRFQMSLRRDILTFTSLSILPAPGDSHVHESFKCRFDATFLRSHITERLPLFSRTNPLGLQPLEEKTRVYACLKPTTFAGTASARGTIPQKRSAWASVVPR